MVYNLGVFSVVIFRRFYNILQQKKRRGCKKHIKYKNICMVFYSFGIVYGKKI